MIDHSHVSEPEAAGEVLHGLGATLNDGRADVILGEGAYT